MDDREDDVRPEHLRQVQRLRRTEHLRIELRVEQHDQARLRLRACRAPRPVVPVDVGRQRSELLRQRNRLVDRDQASNGIWVFGQPDIPKVFLGPLLGCNTASPTTATLQSNVTRTTYTGCLNSSVAVELVVHMNGGHSWSGLTANGFSPQQYAWDFLATHYPTSATPAAPPAAVLIPFAMPGRDIMCRMQRPDVTSGSVVCAVRSTRTSRLPPLNWLLGVSKQVRVSRSRARIAHSPVR